MSAKFKSSILITELPLILSWLSSILFLFYGHHWISNLHSTPLIMVVFTLLFLQILWNSFETAHHAEALAESLQEPYGTLVLTFVAISIEISLIASIMLTGPDNPTLARDTMFSVIMIILNGVVGLSLLLGGIRYREQQYNLQGSIAFLSVIILMGIIGLILP